MSDIAGAVSRLNNYVSTAGGMGMETQVTHDIALILAELSRGAVPVIDLDAIAYERIKKSIDIAHEFLPEEVKPHYELNYWVADICNWLENRHSLAGADGWYLPKKPLNDLQIASVEEQIKRCKQAHFTDIDIRINGKFERRQADWIKHMQPILTRPPVAGLAELTDEQWCAVFDKMFKAWAESNGQNKAAMAKAAREFLGKVDG